MTDTCGFNNSGSFETNLPMKLTNGSSNSSIKQIASPGQLFGNAILYPGYSDYFSTAKPDKLVIDFNQTSFSLFGLFWLESCAGNSTLFPIFAFGSNTSTMQQNNYTEIGYFGISKSHLAFDFSKLKLQNLLIIKVNCKFAY